MVAVLGKTGKKLMPASEYRARKLLAKGRAVIDRYDPFTIRLTSREDGETQPVEFTVDTGYAHVGNSLKTEKHELSAIEVRPPADEKQRRDDRRMYRRQRRRWEVSSSKQNPPAEIQRRILSDKVERRRQGTCFARAIPPVTKVTGILAWFINEN